MTAAEINFYGLVGPTHNYAGLSHGNLAATGNEGQTANPREAALQGLEKMAAMRSLGLWQGVLPPQDRPCLRTLHTLGFRGSDEQILANGWAADPVLMRNLMSASAMWTANAATVTPKWDSADGRTHFTPANLAAMFHRSLEAPTTARLLKAIFADESRFAHHPPLPSVGQMGDEGAANHSRLCADYGAPGIGLFIYGRDAFRRGDGPKRFPARQTRQASEAIIRQHGIKPGQSLIHQQAASAIDAGAFHNDVVAVANKSLLFHHQDAFQDIASLDRDLVELSFDLDFAVTRVAVPREAVSLDQAVRTYLFNAQLVSLPDQAGHCLIVPTEARESEPVWVYLQNMLAAGGPITKVQVMDVRQSMRNGGGPACLRLRVVLDGADRDALSGQCVLDGSMIDALKNWVRRHYRDRLGPDDLRDPALMRESFTALAELSELLALGSVYDFQL